MYKLFEHQMYIIFSSSPFVSGIVSRQIPKRENENMSNPEKCPHKSFTEKH